MILGVVVKFGDLSICLPKPNRHSNCFAYARDIGITNQSNKADDQGFFTAEGKYLKRDEALIYAKKFGMKFREEEPMKYLFSEDLW